MLKNTLQKTPKGESMKGAQKAMPGVDILEDEDNIYIIADLPGVDKKDVNVTLEKDILTIEGKNSRTEQEKKEKYHAEFQELDFRRVFEINEEINGENIVAKVINGVLRLTLPKKKPVKKKIEVELN
ncbi:MAG: Hsp20/alpha crystallin family protein [Spirochaetia bacterium]|nr:Hsp20/alpha crystallin family protein [Spirochaetia bacterium]